MCGAGRRHTSQDLEVRIDARIVTRFRIACLILQLWYRDACKSEGPEHRFSGQTSRVACPDLSTPIDSEFNGHANAGLRSAHAIFSQKSIFSSMGCRELKNSYVKLLYSRVADRKYVHY